MYCWKSNFLAAIFGCSIRCRTPLRVKIAAFYPAARLLGPTPILNMQPTSSSRTRASWLPAARTAQARASMRDVGIVEDGAVAICKDIIVEVGSTSEITAMFPDVETIDADRKVVCPGFVDSHTHIVFAGDRFGEFEKKIGGADYLEILQAGGGILSTVTNTREATEAELAEQTLHRLEKMLQAGTTTAEIKTGYGLDTVTELKMLRVIGAIAAQQPIGIIPTFLAAHAIPPEFKNEPDAYVDLICEDMLAQAWDWYRSIPGFLGTVPFFADVFCEKGAFSLEQSLRVCRRRKGWDLR